ncbi:MAG: redoxin domain-containing protein, partial [Myxococcales bacterium]|nr:redoxin domain-containing protein [Myxococcales bacterium]
DDAPAASATAAPASPAATPAAAERAERPLPDFGGTTLDGRPLTVRSLLGRGRIVLFFFNPEVEAVRPVASAIAAIAGDQTRHNFELVGVAVGSSREKARAFADEIGLRFPILDDSNADITQRLGLRSPVLVLSVDADGYMGFGMTSFPTDAPDAPHHIEKMLRERLRLPEAREPAAANLLARPEAPVFTAPLLDGGEFRLAEHRGTPIVLVFFLHTCPHCHHALEFLKAELPKIEESKRPVLYGVSVVDAPGPVRAALREAKLDFFPVLRDPDDAVRTAYGTFSGVPDIVLIDRDGRIAHRTQGWTDRDEPMMRMQLAKIAGTKVPMLLSRTGYTGNDVCGVCHELEARTWELTKHARAFDTLVTHGADHDAECVSCHVVGFGAPGGFDMQAPVAHLEDVGCETCHGRGGPHLSPDHVASGGYEAVCTTCHNPTHSLGFDFATFRPRISHTAIAALAPEERARLARDTGGPRDVLPKAAAIVGSDACKGCHEAEFATWSASPHARAIDSLAAQGRGEDSACQKCHVTGAGRDGGFPLGEAPSGHPDLARVGCESCHGGGGDHVAPDAPKRGTIVSLGDKCDSCVILQICGSCHDAANDPKFEFSVEEHIERQRHGTIEAGTGKPLSTSALDGHLQGGAARALAALR